MIITKVYLMSGMKLLSLKQRVQTVRQEAEAEWKRESWKSRTKNRKRENVLIKKSRAAKKTEKNQMTVIGHVDKEKKKISEN